MAMGPRSRIGGAAFSAGSDYASRSASRYGRRRSQEILHWLTHTVDPGDTPSERSRDEPLVRSWSPCSMAVSPLGSTRLPEPVPFAKRIPWTMGKCGSLRILLKPPK